MTEQEKKVIKLDLEFLESNLPESAFNIVRDVLSSYQTALDERDQEVERLKEENDSYMEVLQGWYDDYLNLEQENHRLKSLLNGEFSSTEEEIDTLLGVKRQALAGEEKG